VWDSNFLGVWHFPNGTTLSVADSTGLNTSSNSGATAGAGMIDGAAVFGASGTPYINLSGTLSSTGNLTVSMWQTTTNCSSVAVQLYLSGTSGDYMVLGCTGSFYLASAQNTTGASVQSTVAPTGTATYLAATKTTGAANAIYVNGANVTTTATTTLGGSAISYLAGSDYTVGSLCCSVQGYIDELRISNVQRSAGWTSTDYQNQNNPGTIGSAGFWTYGSWDGGSMSSKVFGQPIIM
jgi:hypothetical protein